jgi:hypothetical protein
VISSSGGCFQTVDGGFTMGRRATFTKNEIAEVKRVVSQFGLSGAVVVFAERGVSVSLPTLKKYVSNGLGGRPPVRLRRGRRPKVA